ncbi:anaphase-promoting complex, subunit 10-domain-containing protein [Lipomyces kononenkoae]|uniref:Anaphase-promoting complex, subunit 10-domain-containing protein n=1 Tax=Lipomyces kononenkoae TaxID=34357 RepID=A0ACC3T4H3_LIPKO
MDSEPLTSSELEEQIPTSDAVVDEGQEDEEIGSSGGEHTAGTTAHASEQPAIPLRDIGNQATWKLSTWKPGFGVHALLAESTDLYWQSDAPQPHHIDIHFAKRVEIAKIMLNLDYRRDESYTPSKIAVYAGSGYHDLHEVLSLGLEEPVGWIDISLAHAGKDGFLKAFLVRLSVLQNHQTGKDTHIRGIKILSPDRQASDNDDDGLPFNSIALLAHSTIR